MTEDTAEEGVSDRGVGDRQRVFFALWPDAATAAALHARASGLKASCGGRAMRRDTLHLTLAFLGEVEANRLEALQGIARSMHIERFTLALDRIGSWHGNRVLWCGPSRSPAALDELARALAERLAAAGFALEARGFSPHVTLVRNAQRAPVAQQADAIHWPVASFVLVASERTARGAAYRVLARWPLAGDGKPAPCRTS